jgi:hypothetical protein
LVGSGHGLILRHYGYCDVSNECIDPISKTGGKDADVILTTVNRNLLSHLKIQSSFGRSFVRNYRLTVLLDETVALFILIQPLLC